MGTLGSSGRTFVYSHRTSKGNLEWLGRAIAHQPTPRLPSHPPNGGRRRPRRARGPVKESTDRRGDPVCSGQHPLQPIPLPLRVPHAPPPPPRSSRVTVGSSWPSHVVALQTSGFGRQYTATQVLERSDTVHPASGALFGSWNCLRVAACADPDVCVQSALLTCVRPFRRVCPKECPPQSEGPADGSEGNCCRCIEAGGCGGPTTAKL